MMKITGDNLDMYVRTSHFSSDERNRDLHYFTSNVLFPRICSSANFDNTKPHVTTVEKECCLLTGEERTKLLQGYAVIVGQVLQKHLPGLTRLASKLPKLTHDHEEVMKNKSVIFHLPVQFKNENNLEECVDILDEYETSITDLHKQAFGSIEQLESHPVILGGDQLTRVRFTSAKALRLLSPEACKRTEHLHPVVVEMWHNKMDFVEKCYKTYFSEKTMKAAGTLYHLKTVLNRSDVNGNVKSRFEAHEEFLITVGEALICQQAIEYFGLSKPTDDPQRNIPADFTEETAMETFVGMLQFYSYCQFYEADQADSSDGLFNYSNSLVQWIVHLMHMKKCTAIGDVSRLIINCKAQLPFFYSHSHLSKYFIENVDFIVKVERLVSPLLRMRVLEGAFVNTFGGERRNIEADLAQEHSVRNRKDLIQQLGANKSQEAIQKITSAADGIAATVHNYDKQVSIPERSSYHSHRNSTVDFNKTLKLLLKNRPFEERDDRCCDGVSVSTYKRTPFQKTDINKFYSALETNIKRTVQHYKSSL